MCCPGCALVPWHSQPTDFLRDLKQRVDGTGSLDAFFPSKGSTTRIDSQKTSRGTYPDVRIVILKNRQHWLVREPGPQSSTLKSRTTPSKQSVICAHPQFV